MLSACREDSIASFADPDTRWQLNSLDGSAVSGILSIAFPDGGRIDGQGPCNRFAGKIDAIYPWFEVTELVAETRNCEGAATEATVFDALRAVTLAEVSGPVLILSNEDGLEMVFESER